MSFEVEWLYLQNIIPTLSKEIPTSIDDAKTAISHAIEAGGNRKDLEIVAKIVVHRELQTPLSELDFLSVKLFRCSSAGLLCYAGAFADIQTRRLESGRPLIYPIVTVHKTLTLLKAAAKVNKNNYEYFLELAVQAAPCTACDDSVANLRVLERKLLDLIRACQRNRFWFSVAAYEHILSEFRVRHRLSTRELQGLWWNSVSKVVTRFVRYGLDVGKKSTASPLDCFINADNPADFSRSACRLLQDTPDLEFSAFCNAGVGRSLPGFLYKCDKLGINTTRLVNFCDRAVFKSVERCAANAVGNVLAAARRRDALAAQLEHKREKKLRRRTTKIFTPPQEPFTPKFTAERCEELAELGMETEAAPVSEPVHAPVIEYAQPRECLICLEQMGHRRELVLCCRVALACEGCLEGLHACPLCHKSLVSLAITV
jgi:hypothetical protein